MEPNEALFKCYVCKDRKARWAFQVDDSRRSGLASRCKQCDNAMAKRRHDRRQDGRRAILARAKDKPCMDCGGSYPHCVMDLDHRPGTVKVFNVSNAMRYSVAEILAEIGKCDVVCANCHRIRTHQRATANPPNTPPQANMFI